MLGRGIDQILPHPGDAVICEPYMDSAKGYVTLAEGKNGPIPRSVGFSYVWGDALAALDAIRPHFRIVNLETSITRSNTFWPKGINYRMSPDNVACLSAAKIDCCCLANNHVLDFRFAGLTETIETLRQATIAVTGAGENEAEAMAPAILPVAEGGRVIVFSLGTQTSGIPISWKAGPLHPGVNFLPDLTRSTADQVATEIWRYKQPGDVVIASIHWGSNWGYRVSDEERDFAHCLIDNGEVDIVHGHSSHHPKAIEVHAGKLILYGCGDFINDYEGIGGYETYRDDLALMYLPSVDVQSGKLIRLGIVPFQIRHFRLNRASEADVAWLKQILDREGRIFGTKVEIESSGRLKLLW